jgi:opacity protein-like surface antigen
MRRVSVLLIVMVLIAAVPAMAQDPDKRVNFNIGGGYTFAAGEVRNHLGDGYNFNLGLGVKVAKSLWFHSEYSFNGLGEKKITLPVSGAPGGSTADGDFYGSMNMQYGAFSLVFKPSMEGRARPYFMFGPGVYYRPVEVTTPSVGYIPGYCDPFWYWCYPGGWVPVDKIVGSRSSTDFGVNVGGGVDFAIGDSASIYFEVRYHYIWGPDVEDSTGKSYGKANGQFFPITAGIRF